MKKIKKEDVAKVALGAAAGILIGGAMIIVVTNKTSFVLKNAWYDTNGDMILQFFGRDKVMVIPKQV